MLTLTPLTVGQMGTNCYLVSDADTKDCIIVDPGDDAEYIAEKITGAGYTPRMILATHGHFDHVLAAYALQAAFGIPFRMHEADAFLLDRMQETAVHFLGHREVDPPPAAGESIVPGQDIMLGTDALTVLGTPGHTPGSICLYSSSEAFVLTGDTIFAGGAVGRTDRSYADSTALRASLNTILSLPGGTRIYPGHGEPTDIVSEKQYHRGL